MKILYVSAAGKYGTCTLSRDLFNIWIKHGYKIVYVSPFPANDMLLEFAYKHQIPVYFLPLFRTYQLNRALKLAMIARQEKADIVHASNLPPGRFLCRVAALLSNIPLVLYIGVPSGVYNPHRFIRSLQRFIHRWVAATSQGIIAMTQYVAEELRSDLKISEDRQIAVIPAGIDIALIRKKSYLEFRDNGRTKEPIRLVQVARLAPEKGQDTVLRAIKYVLQKGYRISINFIGGDEAYPGYRNYLYRLSQQLDLSPIAVNFLGFHSLWQVYQELAEYDIFLHPSYNEGQGIAVLEAMAAGLPVVASDEGGLKELVVQEKTGLLVASRDYKALAEAIVRLIENPAKCIEMGEAGYQRVKKEFSLEITESKVIKFYEQLASGFRNNPR